MNRLVLLLPFLLGACTLTPDFELPSMDVPALFKEEAPPAAALPDPNKPLVDDDAKLVADESSWKPAATPAELQELPKNWWVLFGNEELTKYIDEATQNSPTIAAASARVAEARAMSGVVDADLYPQVQAGLGVVRSQSSGAALGLPQGTTANPQTLYRAQGDIAWELDLFGGNLARSRAYDRLADAEEARYQAALLALQADTAQSYFALRALDAEVDALDQTTKLREEALNINKRRLEIGDISELDVARAEAELAQAISEMHAVRQQRAETEHRLAVLLGKPPAALALDANALSGEPPVIPASIPSTLLERRPDIRAAQQQLAAANEGIGLARAAFFPKIGLTAMGGFESNSLSDLFKWSSRSWALGPLFGTELTMPIFQGGQNVANLAASKASYQEAVAEYRGQVLNAFREVEDNLSGLRNLYGQAEAQTTALAAATRAYDIAKLRYENGYVSYLEFMDAERTLLAAKRAEVQVRGGRFITTVQLIRALGGGWTEVKELPPQ